MPDSSWHIQLDTPKIDEILRRFIGSLSGILEEKNDSPAWEPTSDDDDDIPEDSDGIIDHIRSLRIPSLSSRFVDEPPMTIYRLGTFSEQPNLKLRVENLFNGKDTFLVNASGTGKTRLLYEGLCMHWGFYFTSAIDSMRLGFEDLDGAIKKLGRRGEFNTVFSPTSNPEATKHNLRLAHRQFSTILLVRLLVFKAFLTAAAAASCQSDKHKEIWLKLQLVFPFPGMRLPFTELSKHIESRDIGDHVIDDAISEVLSEICASRDTHGQRLFIALDEANVASHSLNRAAPQKLSLHFCRRRN
ncbi:hypothetical protein Moror_5446 [Moniliophthora roreri MCA 2997]|uniref:Uncharacterized protein n=1 Tax=Moniliophthora roreri (strain MCA 2997) TaxID=1381753 RepID=V2WMM7_MONRO|nr:hypothetical protein Moror_5446 [Moniliophthora roreri MCA 2997]